MSQKKNKRTSFPRTPVYTKQFVKDWASLDRSGRYDMVTLKGVMLFLIANDGPLGPEWQDHPLVGTWSGYRECHIGGDFLLIYKIDGMEIGFTRAGTHSELFGG